MELPESWLPANLPRAREPLASTVWLNQKRPGGMTIELAHDVRVAGISRPDAAHNAALLMAGRGRRLVLEPRPDNPVDPNAIAVIGVWGDSSGAEQRGQIGWLPRDVAKTCAAAERIAATIRVMFKPHDGQSPGLRISVWSSSREVTKK